MHFILFEESCSEHLFFKRNAFCKVGWNHLIFHVGCSFFHGAFAVTHSFRTTLFIAELSCSHQFSHGLNKTDNFWLQLPIPRGYFSRTGTLSIQCSNGKSSSHPFFEGYCIYFKGDFPLIIVGEILSGRLSSKNVVLCSFRTNIIISTEEMQLFLAILSFSGTVYFSRAIFYSHLFLIGYCQLLPICKAYCTYFKMENATILCFKGNIFSLSITRYFVIICLSLVHLLFRNRLLWSSSIFTSLKQLHFCNKYFLRTPSCQEQLRLSNNYFLLTSTFPNHKYSFNTTTAFKELLLENK